MSGEFDKMIDDESKTTEPNGDGQKEGLSDGSKTEGGLDAQIEAATYEDVSDQEKSAKKAAQQYQDRSKSIYAFKGMFGKTEL